MKRSKLCNYILTSRNEMRTFHFIITLYSFIQSVMCVAGVYEGCECHILHVKMTVQLWELPRSFYSVGPEKELKSSDLVASTFAHQASLLFHQIYSLVVKALSIKG